jgi:hypothetical protein
MLQIKVAIVNHIYILHFVQWGVIWQKLYENWDFHGNKKFVSSYKPEDHDMKQKW